MKKRVKMVDIYIYESLGSDVDESISPVRVRRGFDAPALTAV